MMMDEYLDNRIAFHGKEPMADDNGITYYFLGIKPDKPKRVAKKLRLSGKEGIVKAIHYKDVDHDELIAMGFLDQNYASYRLPEKPSVVAIHLSHCLALRDFVRNKKGAKWAFIFEEDIALPRGGAKAKRYALQYLKEAESAIPMDEPQLHYIGHCFSGEGGEQIADQLIKGKPEEARPRCRHAYVVNRAGAEELLRKSWPMYDNGDEMWALLDFVYLADDNTYFLQDWQRSMEGASRKPLDTPRPVQKARAHIEKFLANRNGGEPVGDLSWLIIFTPALFFVVAIIALLKRLGSKEEKRRLSCKRVAQGFFAVGILATTIVVANFKFST